MIGLFVLVVDRLVMVWCLLGFIVVWIWWCTFLEWCVWGFVGAVWLSGLYSFEFWFFIGCFVLGLVGLNCC